MEVCYSSRFRKNFNKRIPPGPPLEKRFAQRLALFLKDKNNPILKDHKLIGKSQSFRAFSITGDIRVIYIEESKDAVTFIDIGTHNQVYR